MIDEYKINNRVLFDSVQSRIEKIYISALGRQKLSLGYPLNQKFDYTAIAPFLNLHLNNVGDLYASSSMLLHTHDLEQEALDYFAKLWHASPRTPHSPLIHSGATFWGWGQPKAILHSGAHANIFESGRSNHAGIQYSTFHSRRIIPLKNAQK